MAASYTTNKRFLKFVAPLLQCYTTNNWRVYMRGRINRADRSNELERLAKEDSDGALNEPDVSMLPASSLPPPAIRNGVKTERDTQPVQVRMLKAQIKVLKQIAAQEERSASDVIRELVDRYIEECLRTWPEGDRLDILQSTIRQAGYWDEFERAPSTWPAT
ncbi:ribbon-helix-helix protein, CopG family [Paraburkholderia sp. RP-4-7]|uniref:Ribbon-helix-helix protein, CopG family n=1 Tax=Paraburkholderia polaris TaxID=2728848 RepID=A0A848IF42_9BURK|nr:ribbon-helix-helix protein, CopG family [Paraburkholderia polaris]NML98768.1 ribbon-helix-helix protein, CopG family [Paraburkholderia polaris]